MYVRCDAAGQAIVREGRVDVVYHLGDTKVYRAYPANVQVDPSAEVMADAPKNSAPATARVSESQTPHEASTGDGHWIAYTDGACTGNPGPAGAGFVILGPESCHMEGYEYLGEQTNNIGELVAIECALEAIPKAAKQVTVYTDSQYAIGVLSKGWKAKANVDLIARIRKLVLARPNLEWYYVRGHKGIPLNERADELARRAIAERASQKVTKMDAVPSS